LEEKGWNDVTVIAVETIGADSLSQAIKADKLVTLPAITRYHVNLCFFLLGYQSGIYLFIYSSV